MIWAGGSVVAVLTMEPYRYEVRASRTDAAPLTSACGRCAFCEEEKATDRSLMGKNVNTLTHDLHETSIPARWRIAAHLLSSCSSKLFSF